MNNYAREEGKAYRTGKELNEDLSPKEKEDLGFDDNKLYYGTDDKTKQKEISIGTPREVREAYGYGTGMKSEDINEQEKKYGETEESKAEVDKKRTDMYVANANALKETKANMKKMTEYTRSDKAKMSEEDLEKMKKATALYKSQKAALELAKKLGDTIKPFPPITLEEMGMKDVYSKENKAEVEKPVEKAKEKERVNIDDIE